jgi:hypothetical protein
MGEDAEVNLQAARWVGMGGGRATLRHSLNTVDAGDVPPSPDKQPPLPLPGKQPDERKPPPEQPPPVTPPEPPIPGKVGDPPPEEIRAASTEPIRPPPMDSSASAPNRPRWRR